MLGLGIASALARHEPRSAPRSGVLGHLAPILGGVLGDACVGCSVNALGGRSLLADMRECLAVETTDRNRASAEVQREICGRTRKLRT